nr:hypothetical protein [Nanoarchaeum sp.]
MKLNKDTRIALVFWVAYSIFSIITQNKSIVSLILFLLIGAVLVFAFLFRKSLFKRKARAVIREEEIPGPLISSNLPLPDSFDNVFKEDFGVRDVD